MILPNIFLNESPKKVEIKFEVEAFKGALEIEALKEIAKKEFAAETNLTEVVLLGDLKKADPDFKNILDKNLMFSVKTSEDFVTSYVLCINNDDDLVKITALITEKVSEVLQKILDENKQIIRIKK